MGQVDKGKRIQKIFISAAVLLIVAASLCGCTFEAGTKQRGSLAKVHIFVTLPDELKGCDRFPDDLRKEFGNYLVFTEMSGGTGYRTYLSLYDEMQKDICLKPGTYKVAEDTRRKYCRNNFLETKLSFSGESFQVAEGDNQIELKLDNADELISTYKKMTPLKEMEKASMSSGKIQLNGKVISFPVTVHDLLKEAFPDIDVNSVSKAMCSPGEKKKLILYPKTEEDEFGTQIVYINDTANMMASDLCKVISISSYRGDLVLPGGINRSMLCSDVSGIYGQAMKMSGSPFIGLNMDMLDRYAYDSHINNSSSLTFTAKDVTAKVYFLGRWHRPVEHISYSCTKGIDFGSVSDEK